MITRRRFVMAAAATLAAGAGVCLYTFKIGPHHIEFARRDMPIIGLPARLDGLTLAHMTDIHVGPQVADLYVAGVFDRVREITPDIVAYTGDYISEEHGIQNHATRMYANLPRGRLATVATLGNHDYGPSWSKSSEAAWVAQMLRDNGVTVLRNEVADVGGLQVVGMDDLWANQFDPKKAFASHDRDRASLVLSHNPDTADEDGWGNYAGWILSGHTHGGQCKPPFLPPPMLPVRNKRYTAGEFDVGNNRRLYVNRGVGHLLAVRFNVRPEVAVFTLRRA